ncbi:MAG: hypothetical protein JWP87_4250, partial [Labilithrix sp.]|nr:hypothetical protein [Labilithrix sp.]
AGADGGSPGPGAGAAPDAPGEDGTTSGGCACQVTPARDDAALLAPGALAIAAALIRRRRRR